MTARTAAACRRRSRSLCLLRRRLSRWRHGSLPWAATTWGSRARTPGAMVRQIPRTMRATMRPASRGWLRARRMRRRKRRRRRSVPARTWTRRPTDSSRGSEMGWPWRRWTPLSREGPIWPRKEQDEKPGWFLATGMRFCLSIKICSFFFFLFELLLSYLFIDVQIDWLFLELRL